MPSPISATVSVSHLTSAQLLIAYLVFRKIELHLAKLLHNDSDIQRLGHAWADQVHIEGGARVSSRHRPSSLPVTGEALPDSTGCISGVFSDGNSQIPLSASAQALVSTTQNAPLTPRVKPEALPVWIDTVTGVNSVGLSTQGLSEPIEDKMREPDEQGKHVTVLPQSPAEVTRSTTPTDTPQAAVVSVPDTATRRSYSVTDTNINDDDERNLLPHQRSKVVRTSVCSANSATPVAVAAPVGQHASVACSVQGNSAVSLVGSRPEHENTPPHLRSIIKLDTIPSISYR